MARIPTFDARAPRTGQVSGYASSGGAESWSAIASAAGQISGRLGQMADKAVIRENREEGKIAGGQVTMPSVDFAFDQAVGGPWKDQAKALLRKEEGFRASPYYDVNAHRVGYGSDTAQIGGRSVPVTPGMTITREQAEADLEYRLTQREGRRAQKQLGDAWERLPDNAKAALASVAYNYGSLPDSVLPAARSGDLQALASAVAVLESNPDRRKREADLILQNGGVRVSVTGTAGPMPQKRGGTLAGDAFNEAAGQIYMNRLDTSMRQAIDALEIQHADDPAALDQAMRASHAGFVTDLPPAARAEFDASFEARRVSAISASVKRSQQLMESRLQASFEEKIAARSDTALRLAMQAGADPAADDRIAAELASIGADIDASPMTPLAKSRARRGLEQDVVKARILGGFDSQAGPAERQAYLQRFQEEWKAGEGFGGRVAAEDYERITSSMMQQIQRDEVQAEKRIKEIDGAIGAQTNYLEKGLPVPQEVRQTLAAAVAETGDEALAGRMDFFDRLSEWQKAHTGARPQVLDAQIAALESRIATEGATAGAMTTLDVMTGLRKQMEIGLKQDPLGWAQNAGVAEVAPLDVTNAAAFTSSLSGRVAAAQAIASHYDVPPVYFRPAERAALIKAAEKDPLMLPQMAGSMIAAFGSDTPRALAELSPDAPVIAHVADLQHRTGDPALTVEAAEALAMRQAEGYKTILPGNAKIQSAATPMLGPALSHAPGAASAALETASAIFEYRAKRRGIDTSKMDDPADPAHELFMEALDASVGGRVIGGVKHGGFAMVNGRQTIAPEDMPADRLEDLVNGITADDLITQQEIVSANGVAIRPSDIANGLLVYAGPGRYHVALGDPATGDPRFIGTRDGRRWTLDTGLLQAARRQTTRTGGLMDSADPMALQLGARR